MPLCIYCRSFCCPEGEPCGICANYLDELKDAHRAFLRLIVNNVWWGRLVTDGEVHLTFRLADWNDHYPDPDPLLDVRCGVHLYSDRVRTFYLIDADEQRLEIEYGSVIQLPSEDEFDWWMFQGNFLRQFYQAAETAHEAGWRECQCGSHVNSSVPHDHSIAFDRETGE